MPILHNILEAVGHTPLVEICGLKNQQARIVVKLESFNPGGSIKDRTALAMIEEAERNGQLTKGSTIIEPTSGNTGIGLAWIGKLKGYQVVLTMPDTMSQERRDLLRAYGAELVLTDGTKGMAGAIEKAKQLQAENPKAVILDQFTNPANARVHELTTGEELWQDTDGQIDAFVAGVGTGGTLIGIARCLKRHNNKIYTVAVEPANSAVLSGKQAGAHALQGIGAGFVPQLYDSSVVDEVIAITDEDAREGAKLLAARYSILTGMSAGAAFAAATRLAQRPEWQGKMIGVILPDSGERYLSLMREDRLTAERPERSS